MSTFVRTVVVCFVYLAGSDHFRDNQNPEHPDGAETGRIRLAAAVTPLALNVKDSGSCPCLSAPCVQAAHLGTDATMLTPLPSK